MRWFVFLLALFTAACSIPLEPAPAPVQQPQMQTSSPPGFNPTQATAAFAAVKRAVEPVAERECRARTQGLNCDFRIGIDPDPKAPANAYQSLDRSGRPVITFTRAMLADITNRDELAFVMSHETAHHIRGHLARQQRNALSGAILLAGLATAAGGNAADIANAQDLGAIMGARSYSKDFELEADQLGTIVTHKSGYSPRAGVLFFNRLPDPGDRFLGTHPPNHDRVQVVQQTIQQYNLN